jgi:predicted metalloprotease with PDZ domain
MFAFRALVLILVFSAVAFASTSGETPTKLSYVFTPDLHSSPVPVLHVKLEFQGNQDGFSILILPTTWAGQRDLYRSITNLNTDSGTHLKVDILRGEVNLSYQPKHKVQVAYDLSSDWTDPLRHPKEFRVVVRATNCIFNGQNGLVYPALSQTHEVQAQFEWRNLPRGWVVASSFGSSKNKIRLRGPWHEVQNALFTAGDFRITHLSDAGESLTLAARGSWIFSDQDAAEEIVSLFRVERQFWGETRKHKFLVVLTAYDQDQGSSDGTAFTDSFLLYLSRKQTFLIDIKSQLAHEVFHTWNPYQIGRASGDVTEWFTEGFTRYYQDRILLQARLVSYPEYINRLNQIVTGYWSSPERNWTQQQWLDHKQSGDSESELPYQRGAVIALWLDETIRRETTNKLSLDDRMFALLGSKGSQMTTESLISTLSDGLSSQLRKQLRSFVEDGTTIPLPTRLEPGCAMLISGETLPSYKSTAGKDCENQLASRRVH